MDERVSALMNAGGHEHMPEQKKSHHGGLGTCPLGHENPVPPTLARQDCRTLKIWSGPDINSCPIP